VHFLSYLEAAAVAGVADWRRFAWLKAMSKTAQSAKMFLLT
jgi:hypothetical protein